MKVKVRVPATAANLGAGFNCLGLALELYDTLEISEVNCSMGKYYFTNIARYNFDSNIRWLCRYA